MTVQKEYRELQAHDRECRLPQSSRDHEHLSLLHSRYIYPIIKDENAALGTSEYARLRSLDIKYIFRVYVVERLSYSLYFYVCSHGATVANTGDISDITVEECGVISARRHRRERTAQS